MKIIRVVLDDYDKPLVGQLVVSDDRVEETVNALRPTPEHGKTFIIEVHTPDTLEEVLAEMEEVMKEVDE